MELFQIFRLIEGKEKAMVTSNWFVIGLGMGTVFVVLILISLIISLFGLIPKIQKASAEKKKLAEQQKNAATSGIDNAIDQIIENETQNETADTELVAVIAAAIAACEGTSADGFVVRSIRRRYR